MALYPDPLIAVMLPASAYPVEVVLPGCGIVFARLPEVYLALRPPATFCEPPSGSEASPKSAAHARSSPHPRRGGPDATAQDNGVKEVAGDLSGA